MMKTPKGLKFYNYERSHHNSRDYCLLVLLNSILVILMMIVSSYGSLADNKPYAYKAGELLCNAVNMPPKITAVDLLNATNVSRLDTQIDVNQEYHIVFNVTDNDTLEDLAEVLVLAWFDEGDEYSSPPWSPTKPNYQLVMRWTPTQGFELKYPTTGEVKLGNCINVTLTPYKMHFEFYFTPGNQTRYAIGDGRWDPGPGNDLYSWNFMIACKDKAPRRPNWGMSGTEGNYWEFGYYRYTDIKLNRTIVGRTGYPGENVTTPFVGVTTVSNGAFLFNVSLLGNLVNLTLAVSIEGSRVGLHYSERFLGWFKARYPSNLTAVLRPIPPVYGTYSSHSIKYCIDIPLGTLACSYKADVKYIIIQI